MTVEYLIILKQDDNFCSDIESLKKFISVDKDLVIEGGLIKYMPKSKTMLDASILIRTGTIDGKNERYFNLTMSIDDTKKVDLFSLLCRKVKKIVSRINPNNTRINTLWDDIGREYAVNAYPLINEVENLMRKLISQFLLINVGMDWSGTTMHSDLKDKINKKIKNQIGIKDELYQVDFIQLSEVLFKKYRSIEIGQLDNIILGAKDKKLDFNEVSKILPISNWERYFSKIIDYDETKLQEQWGELYSFRNDIAHNRFIQKSDFNKIVKIQKEIKKLLIKTIEDLGQIELKEEQKEEVQETYIIYTSVSAFA